MTVIEYYSSLVHRCLLYRRTAIHSFHSDPRVRKPTASDIPDQSSLHHLLLQPSDYPILQAAYLVDLSNFNGVSISDLYRVVTNLDINGKIAPISNRGELSRRDRWA